MSATNAESHAAHDAGHGDDGHAHGSLRGYLIGFFLSVVLTAIPFWLVMGEVLPNKLATTAIILAFALVQILVHMVFFLHMTTAPDNTNNVLALAFGILIVALIVAGSLWIMAHLNHRMMTVDEVIRMQR